MVVKNLEFFDKDGYNLNLNWNEKKQIWEGNIFFPRVSVGLYENTTIYVVEYKDNTGEYTYPTGDGSIIFQWDIANTFVDEFFMFNFDENYEITDTSALIYTPYDGPLCETLIINRFDKYSVQLNLNDGSDDGSDDGSEEELLEIHVAFKANEKSAATTYKRTLVMSYENKEIARITFFAETIEEDERLKIWNENLGYNLKPEDTLLFKHSDIHECLPNYEILNEKRKELMLEGSNIYPYIGGYKAIINMIKFFGYDNLNIVEYWKNINEYNIDFGKLYRTYIYNINNRKTLSYNRKPISLNTKDFQKLNNISLAYNINHSDNTYDEYGLPNVTEDFDKDKSDDFILTIEEALVKLFALKTKLNNEFMPGSTKITDIIGEGNYFGLNLIGNNPQISTINYIESKGYIDFSVFPDKYCYITENNDFLEFYKDEIKSNENSDSDSDNIVIDDIDNEQLCKYYEDYYNITYDNKFGDAQNYGLREQPKPENIKENESFEIYAKVILKGTFNENIDGASIIEWKITHTENKGEPIIRTGDVKKYGSVFVQLPYLGNYDVEMTVWDVYNHCCKKYIKDAIIVKPYNIEIKGFYLDNRPLPDNLKYDLTIPQTNVNNYEYYFWLKNNGNNRTNGIVTRNMDPLISDILCECDSKNPFTINIKFALIDEDTIKEIDKNKLIYIKKIKNNISNGRDTLNISWIDSSDKKYGIDEYIYFGKITNDDIFGENNTRVEEWYNDDLYNVIKENFNNMYNEAIKERTQNHPKDNNISMVYEGCKGPYYKHDVDIIKYRIDRKYKEYDHLNEEIIDELSPGDNYKYVRYINSVVDIKPLTWVLLGFDFTKITGRLINKEYPKWTLTKIELEPNENLQNYKTITTYNGLYFTYLFEDEGVYNITLEIQDKNYNNYVLTKSIVIVDKDANYEMYHTLKDEYDKYLEAKNERNLIYLN